MYIFLDCDGVINQQSTWRTLPYHIDMKCIAALGLLGQKLPGVKIVLSSTWRRGTGDARNKDVPQVAALKAALSDAGLPVVGVTPSPANKTRQEEIEYYVRRNGISEYVILDDEEALFSETKHLYVVSAGTGLTEQDVAVILKRTKKGIYRR